jgi:hypothetical protein
MMANRHQIPPHEPPQEVMPDACGSVSVDAPDRRPETTKRSEDHVFTFHRVYALPAGTHTFAARMSCQGQLTVFPGWLTAYELPAPASTSK